MLTQTRVDGMAFLTLGGHQLYYEWQGPRDPARETAVFLHDGLGAVGAWKRVPERIGAGAGVNALVYDRWGYGRSGERESFPFGFMAHHVLVSPWPGHGVRPSDAATVDRSTVLKRKIQGMQRSI